MKKLKLVLVSFLMLGLSVLNAADSVPHEYSNQWGPHELTVSEIRVNTYGIFVYGTIEGGVEKFLVIDPTSNFHKEMVAMLYTAYSGGKTIYATFDKNIMYPTLATIVDVRMSN